MLRCTTGRIPIPATTGQCQAQPRKQKVRRPAAKNEAARQGNQRQAARATDHCDLDRAAKGQGLRQQRVVRGKSGVDRHEGAFDPDGRVQRHPEEQDAPLQYLQRRADALHAAHHLVGHCDACRRAAGLSGVARLHPHADGVCREDVELDQDGRARDRLARRDLAANFSHPLLVAQKVVPQPLIADDPKTGCPGRQERQGRGRRRASPRPRMHKQASISDRPVGHAAPSRTPNATPRMRAAPCRRSGPATLSDAGPPSRPASEANGKAPASEPVKTEDGRGADRSHAAAKSDEVKSETPATEVAKTEPAKIEAPKVEETKTPEAKTPNRADTKAPKSPLLKSPRPRHHAGRCARREERPRAPARRRKGGRRKARTAPASGPDRGVHQPQGFKTLRSAELRAAVRGTRDDRAERPAAGHACVHRRNRQERSQPAALVGGLAAGHGPQRGTDDDEDRSARRRKIAGGAPTEAKPLPLPNSPAEALDRITIPQDAMARSPRC